jgi:thioesterase III
MAGEKFFYDSLIRENHLDSFGHVNNAKYLELFEESRWDTITARGYGLQDVQRLQQGPVILEANVRFSKELKLREKIRISFQAISSMGKVTKLEQILYNSEGEVSATAQFTVGFLDLQSRRLVTPTPGWLKAIGWTG